MRQIRIQFLARESLQVILHGDALPQRLVHLERQLAAQQRLADQQRKLLERRMAQQLGFVADQNRVLLFALIQPHDGV